MKRLFKFGIRNDFEVLQKTIQVVSVEEYPLDLCNAIVVSFKEKKLLELCDTLLDSALIECNSETMFREDTPATAVVTSVLRLKAVGFCRAVCKPVIKMLSRCDRVLEINDSKVGDSLEVAENIVSVYDAVTEAIERIHENRSFFTRKVRDILHLVYRKSEETHAGSGISMVGSFLFLRFICPALLSPKAYDIIDYDISADVLRGLVLVVKILQNVVNGVEFDGTKEQYMVCMNTLVTTYHKELQSDIKYILDEDNKPVRRSKQITSSYEAQHAPKDAYLTLSLYYYDNAKSIFGVLV
eukprot:CAMPEP_0206184812 /NCGR_PEP_ID=MMETSP0166-20121206/1435_1 /ASSEMBLY_ACC=CAM_ASM_000260 /TAXON_ID=95228 /ORGANISM="Vannella robusta, Strain DIVA3 518/3/11/1/6" /LENGTH=297 /DNA_ID=CAMNT_0053599887 /DNA_START=171 /DNA_END=1061 /DNA_ORIENTATION=-